MQHEQKIANQIIRIIGIFWMLMKLMSLKLWLTSREYPLLPVVEMPAVVHATLYALFFVLGCWIVLKPQHTAIMITLIGMECISLLADQNRLQPWHYQYLFTFFAIAFNAKNPAKALQAIVFITISTYLFSGLQKLNSGFIDTVWSVYILRVFLKLPQHVIHHPAVQLSGWLLPAIEIAGGMLLFFKSTMRAGVIVLSGMHIFILLFLGPFGLNYNMIVWPWNVQMILLLFLLFSKNRLTLQPALMYSTANVVVGIFWFIMPIAGLFGKWDKFLSSSMYSGRGKLYQFYFENKNQVPEALKKYAINSKKDSSAHIVVTDWSVAEMNVAAVTEPRVLSGVVKQLNERYPLQPALFVLSVKTIK